MNYFAMHRAHSWVMMAFLRTKATILEFATRRVGPSTDFIALNRFLLRCSFGFSGILPAEAELMYINEVERLDGFGQEIFPVKVAPTVLASAVSEQHRHLENQCCLRAENQKAWLSHFYMALVSTNLL